MRLRTKRWGYGLILSSIIAFICFSNIITTLANYTVIATITGITTPYGTSVNPNTNRIYTTNNSTNSLSVIDGNTNTVLATIPVGSGPHGGGINPVTNRVYVPNLYSNWVTEIDGSTNTVLRNIATPGGSTDVIVDPTTNLLYVPLYSLGQVAVVDLATGIIITNITVGSLPLNITVNPATQRVYVANQGSNTVSVINTSNNTVVTNIPVGNLVSAVAINPNTNRLYTANYSSANVSVIDTLTNTVIATVATGSGANDLAVNTNTNQIFVTNSGINNVSLIDGNTNTVVSTIPVGNGPGSVAVNHSTNRVYVSNTASNSVSVIANITAPTIQKSFGANSIVLNTSTSLTFTISNPNALDNLSAIHFTDSLPTGLVVATPNGLVNNCGGTVTAVSASTSVDLTGGVLTNNSQCVITLNVTGTTVGNKVNQTGAISALESGSGNPSNTDTLTVTLPGAPTLNKSFTPSTIKPGGKSTLTLELNNPNSTPLTNVSFTDQLPLEMQALTPLQSSNNCGNGSISLGANNSVVVSGITLAGNQTCQLSVQITSDTTGKWTNIIDSISANPIGISPIRALAVLTVSKKEQKGQPADIVAQLRVSPDRKASITPENLITYTLKVKNRGLSAAINPTIIFPLNPNLTIGYATFSNKDMWVSAIVTDTEHPYVQLTLPDIEPEGEALVATLVFRPAPEALPGEEIFTRYKVLWDDSSGPGKAQQSNAVRFYLSEDTNLDETGGAVQLYNPVTLEKEVGESVTFSGDFYAPGEVVDLWYTDSAGISTPLGSPHANEKGYLSFSFNATKMQAGEIYTVAGFGVRSEVTGRLILKISPPPSESN